MKDEKEEEMKKSKYERNKKNKGGKSLERVMKDEEKRKNMRKREQKYGDK